MIEHSFIVFEENDSQRKIRTDNIADVDYFTKIKVELDEKENMDVKRRKDCVQGKETSVMLASGLAVKSSALPVEVDATKDSSVRRRSNKSRKSSGSRQTVPSAHTKGKAEKAMLATAQSNGPPYAGPTEAALVKSCNAIEIVLDKKVSMAEYVKSAVAETQPGVKKICSALRRTIPKKNLNPAKCLDIIDRIYENYYDLEAVYTAKPYLENQKDINAKMRAILVDWIVEVHYKFKLQQATLWLCVNIIDRFLESTPTMRSDLQLVGVSALLIACKFEEIYPPEVRDCIYITDYAYTREQVLAMESKILCQLDYHICVPTGYHFMTRFLNSFSATEQVRYLSFYYAERNLQEYDMLSMRPNKFAASALYAALNFRLTVKEDKYQAKHPHDNPWTTELETLTGFSKTDLVLGACNILRHVQEETVTASKRQLIAAKKKYAADKYNAISTLPVPQLIHQLHPVPVASCDVEIDV